MMSDDDGIPPGVSSDTAGDKVQVEVKTNSKSMDSSSVDSSSSGSTVFARERPLPESEVWFKTYWRPAAAWLYLFINLFDFVLAPVIMMLMPKLEGIAYTPWVPLTLANGGMFHLAMGAIIGVTAWGRTRERVTGLIQ